MTGPNPRVSATSFVVPSPRFRLLGFVALLAAPALACGGPDAAGDAPEGARGDQSVRFQCEPGGRRVESVDANNDGNPDIRHVFEGARETCTQFDMNFDGSVDITRFYA